MKFFRRKSSAITFCIVFLISLVSQFMLGGDVWGEEQEVEIYSVTQVSTDNEIEFTMKVQNNSNKVFKDLKYEAKLCFAYSTETINVMKVVTGGFSVGKQNLEIIKFKIDISEDMPKGEYFAIIDVQGSASTYIGQGYVEMGEIGTSEDYLVYDMSSVKILTEEGEVDGLSGPSFNAGVSPKLKVKVKNASNKAMSVKPFVRLYQRAESFNPEPVFEGSLSQQVFGANEEKVITMNLPSREIPESYFVGIEFVNSANKKVSGIIGSRFVVLGASAKIIRHNTSLVENVLKMEAEVIGPADSSTLENVLVSAEVYNAESRKSLTKKEKVVDLGSQATVVRFEHAFNYDAKNLIVVYSVDYEGKELASVENTFLLDEIEVDESEKVFSDVDNYKFKKAILELAKLGIVNGYPDGTFRPEKEITRAEFSVVMCYLLGKNEDAKSANLGNSFVDVQSNHWASGFIKVLLDEGYIKGYPGNQFKPSNKITYAEAITVIVNIMKGEEVLSPGNTWYEPFVNYAKNKGITNGIYIMPDEFTIRGEVAEMTYNAYNWIN